MANFGGMDQKLKNGIALSLVPQVILVKWLAGHPELIEKYYSQGIYPVLSGFLRMLYGWVPFSVGDLIYTFLFFLSLRYVIVRRTYIRQHPLRFLRNIAVVLSVAYFTFHVLWGLNYYRVPLSKSLHLSETYSYNELLAFTEQLIVATNNIHGTLSKDSTARIEIPYKRDALFMKTLEGYQDLELQFPSLAYCRPSIKSSIYSTLLTYMGYGGYLNPFTNEAQVNTRLPRFRFPVVAGHEIGHQIGYSAENETNFVGYIVTLNNKDPYLQYAAMAYGLSYCLGDIRRLDKAKFEELYTHINKGVQDNFEEMNRFWAAYENPMEPVFKEVFSSFLKANNQAAGIQSYNLVVSLLVTYHSKNPLVSGGSNSPDSSEQWTVCSYQ